MTYIAGNPPFSGQGKKDPEQTESLKIAWGTDYTGYLDFATGWYRKASRFFAPEPGTEYAEVPGNLLCVHQLDYAGTARSRSVWPAIP